MEVVLLLQSRRWHKAEAQRGVWAPPACAWLLTASLGTLIPLSRVSKRRCWAHGGAHRTGWDTAPLCPKGLSTAKAKGSSAGLAKTTQNPPSHSWGAPKLGMGGSGGSVMDHGGEHHSCQCWCDAMCKWELQWPGCTKALVSWVQQWAAQSALWDRARVGQPIQHPHIDPGSRAAPQCHILLGWFVTALEETEWWPWAAPELWVCPSHNTHGNVPFQA